jgi:homeobox-leucine zipper protein
MSFGGFLENSTGGGGARVVVDIPYSNNYENSLLREENDKLRAENMSIRDAMRNPICSNCGGPAIIGEISLDEQHLRIENARLKDELDRVCALAGKFLGRPISSSAASIGPPLSSSSLEHGVGSHA